MLTLPAGTYTLDRPLTLGRSKTVLRGAGSGATRLLLPHSLMDLFGALASGDRAQAGTTRCCPAGWIELADLLAEYLAVSE